MRLFIRHRTDYRFSEPQSRLVQLLRLTPVSHEGQNVVDWRIDVDCDARLKHSRDGFGNEVTMLYIDGPLDHIGLTVTGEVLTQDRAGLVAGAPEPLPPLVFTQRTALTRPSPDIEAFAKGVADGGGSRLDIVHRLNVAVHEHLRVVKDRTEANRDAAAIFVDGFGIGQDFAHLFIAAAREIGFPARYVSGHLYRPEDGAEQATHAWAEAHVEGYGWIGFDPVHEICPHDAFVRVAVGLDHHDAAPVSGARTGRGEEQLEVGVRVGLSQAQTQA